MVATDDSKWVGYYGNCRSRLELMKVIYNEDLSPSTPEQEQGDFFHCLATCYPPSGHHFSFSSLLPSRLVAVVTVVKMVIFYSNVYCGHHCSIFAAACVMFVNLDK